MLYSVQNKIIAVYTRIVNVVHFRLVDYRKVIIMSAIANCFVLLFINECFVVSIFIFTVEVNISKMNFLFRMLKVSNGENPLIILILKSVHIWRL